VLHLAAAFLLGLITACGFAPLDLWPLTLIGFAGLMWLVQRAPTLRRSLALGWWFGLGHFVMGLNWIATAFYYQDAMPHWLGWIAVGVLSLYLAVYPAAAAGLAWRWGRGDKKEASKPNTFEEIAAQSGIPLATAGASALLAARSFRSAFVPLFAAAWVVTEWLRSTMFTGFAWNPLGVVTVPLLPIAELAQWVGTYGLSGLVILASGFLLSLTQVRELAKPSSGTIVVILLAAPFIAFFIFALTKTDERTLPTQGPHIRIVQPNIGQQDKWRKGYERRNFGLLADLTGPATREPRLILWPEAAVPDYLEEEPLARARLAGLLGPGDLLLTGGVALEYDRSGELVAARNSLFGLDASGRLLGRYDKSHLVPYGEYLPMRPILSAIGLSRLAPGDLDFWPGPGPATIALPGFGKAGIQICYEIVFSGHVVDAKNRPDFLFNPSNDAWFGAWGPPQHLAQARLRAIEEGLPVIRSTPTGISAVIDADGRLIAHLPWRQAGYIDARLPKAHAPTPFARLGNLLSFLFAAFLIAIAIAVRRRGR
jgi:apolipoprotein N-acyltransferase